MLKSEQLSICNINLTPEPGHMYSKINYFCSTQKGEVSSKKIQKSKIFWTALRVVCPLTQTTQGIQKD